MYLLSLFVLLTSSALAAPSTLETTVSTAPPPLSTTTCSPCPEIFPKAQCCFFQSKDIFYTDCHNLPRAPLYYEDFRDICRDQSMRATCCRLRMADRYSVCLDPPEGICARSLEALYEDRC
jgi:hypothetical protein